MLNEVPWSRGGYNRSVSANCRRKDSVGVRVIDSVSEDMHTLASARLPY